MPTPSHHSFSATLALEQPGRDCDRTQGCLAAWYRPRRLGLGRLSILAQRVHQTSARRLSSRPIEARCVEHRRHSHSPQSMSDIVVECLHVTEPDGARLCFQRWARSARRVPTVKRRARTLEWRLPGFGSGVPSKTDWFEIDLARDPAAAFVEIEVVIMFTRRMMFSRRFATGEVRGFRPNRSSAALRRLFPVIWLTTHPDVSQKRF